MKTRNHDLDNYLMKPTVMSNGILLYPINMMEYDDFKDKAYKYIVLGINKLNNKLKQQWEQNLIDGVIDSSTKFKKLEEDNLFDYIKNICNLSVEQKNKTIEAIKHQNKAKEEFKSKLTKEELVDLVAENPSILDELEEVNISQIKIKTIADEVVELIEIIVRCKVLFDGKCFSVLGQGDSIKIIDKENFEEFRSIVFKQNLLFEPRVGANLMSQKSIDTEMKVMFKDETSIESMVAFLGDIDEANTTYYRLRARYEAEKRKLDYMASVIYRANGNKLESGSEIPIPNLLEPLGLNVNPYTIGRTEVDSDEINKAISK